MDSERVEDEGTRERRRFEVGAFCTHCGTKKRTDALYCSHCGARLPQPEDFVACADAQLQVEVSCPGCGGGLRLTLPLAGRQFRCPKCGSGFRAFINTALIPEETSTPTVSCTLGYRAILDERSSAPRLPRENCPIPPRQSCKPRSRTACPGRGEDQGNQRGIPSDYGGAWRHGEILVPTASALPSNWQESVAGSTQPCPLTESAPNKALEVRSVSLKPGPHKGCGG